jgi:hypothetical protein
MKITAEKTSRMALPSLPLELCSLATSGTQEFIHNKNYEKITIITAISFQEKKEFISLKII